MRITRKNFLKTGASAIAACIGLGETRCSDDDAPPAQSPGGSGGSSGTGGSAGTAGVSGGAGAPASGGTGAGQSGSGGQSGGGGTGGSAANGAMDAGADASHDGSDAAAGSAGNAGTAGTGGSAGSDVDAGICHNVNVDITTDHLHDLLVPSADIVAGVAKSYTMTGDHDHSVMLRAIDFERLRAGQLVETNSTEDDGHSHRVEIRCG
jgi:hypothetical protein